MSDTAPQQPTDSAPIATDPRSYLIMGQDAKGHSERIWCRVMPQVKNQLGILFASRQFPFRSIGDVIRWCIDYGLRELQHRRGSGPSVMRQVDVVMEILRDEIYQQDFSQMFETLHTVVNRHMAANAMGEARRLVAMGKHHIEEMPDGYWRDKYLAELDGQFGHLLSGEGVKIR